MLRRIDAFLDAMTYERGLAPLTREAYASDLKELQAFVAHRGRHDWKQVSSGDLVAHLEALRARGYADASLLRYVAAFKTFFAWLLDEGFIPYSPTDTLASGKHALHLPRTIEERTLNELIEAIDGNAPLDLRDRAILEVLYGCGLRCSELIGLNLHDLNRDARTLRVRGKGHKERVVPFGPPAATAITRYLRHRQTFAMTYRKGALAADLIAPDAPLFLSPTGKRLNRSLMAAIVHARIHAFLPDGAQATPHTLRHAFATHLLSHGAPLMDIRDLLGHASVSTTQIYTHVSDAHLRKVFNACFPRK